MDATAHEQADVVEHLRVLPHVGFFSPIVKPRNALGGIVASQRFAGGPDPEGGDGWVPNITQKGLSDWSEKDIAYMLETGDTPEGDSVGGAMAQVVKNTAQISADDRAAIAAYVKALPPVEGPPKPPKKQE